MLLDSGSLDDNTLKQGTREWLQWRRTHVGASDQTHLQWSASWSIGWGALWDIKMGHSPEQSQSEYMARGNELESHALMAYSLLKNSEFKPAIVESDKYSFLSASLDAVNDRGEVAEIKCPGAEDHALASNGEIPRKYIPQLCHQLFVTEAPHIDYVSYDGSNIQVVRYQRNQDLIDRVIESAKRFYSFMVVEKRPEEFPLPEFDTRIPVINDGELTEEALLNTIIRDDIARLEERLEQSNNRILSMCNLSRAKISNLLQIVTSERKGSIQYSKVPALNGLDLESFRSAPTVTRSIRRIKE